MGVDGIKASPIKPETQINMIMPLANILKQSGCEITTDNEITATGRRSKKKIVIYPAMWVEPHAANTIFVSDAYIKYAKPYAVQKVIKTTLIISKKPGNTGISRDIRTEFTTDLLLSD